MSWTAIWTDTGTVVTRSFPPDRQGDATFLVEGRAARPAAGLQPVWRGRGAAALALDRDTDGTFILRHGDFECGAATGLVEPGDRFRLTYRVGEAAGMIEVKNLESDLRLAISVPAHRPLGVEDVTPDGMRDRPFPGLAALANHNAPCGDRAGLETGALVATPGGDFPVERLHPGAVVLDAAGRPARVLSVETREAVTLGSMPAVRLRAPYFGLTRDLCLSHSTRLMLSGPEVEYTFGIPAVMARAADMVNGQSVLRDMTAPVRVFHRVELAGGGCLRVGRARVSGADPADDAGAPCPTIDRAGAQALVSPRRDPRALIG